MNKKFIIGIFLIFLNIQVQGQENIMVKGKISNEIDGNFIGAIVEEYGNRLNNVVTNFNGEFALLIQKRNRNILRITYAGGQEFLYDLLVIEGNTVIEIYTKRAIKKTKKIQRQLNRTKPPKK